MKKPLLLLIAPVLLLASCDLEDFIDSISLPVTRTITIDTQAEGITSDTTISKTTTVNIADDEDYQENIDKFEKYEIEEITISIETVSGDFDQADFEGSLLYQDASTTAGVPVNSAFIDFIQLDTEYTLSTDNAVVDLLEAALTNGTSFDLTLAGELTGIENNPLVFNVVVTLDGDLEK